MKRKFHRVPKRRAPALTYEQLINEITLRHPTMSRRLREIARFVIQSPNDVAIESVKTLALRARVQPSALVRFAQALGFSGFSAMQRVFQSRLVSALPGFNDRLRTLKDELGSHADPTAAGLLRELVAGDMAALEQLLATVSESDLDKAIYLIRKARTVWTMAEYRAQPVAFYLHYALVHLHRDVRIMDGAGGMAGEQARSITKDSVLVAITFPHYDREVVQTAEAVHGRGVPVIAITDGSLSPLASHASVIFQAREGKHSFLRSLSAALCLVQALAVGLARRLEPEYGGAISTEIW